MKKDLHLRFILLFAATLSFNAEAFAQESDDGVEEESECVRTLNRCQKDFEAGLLEKIEQPLRPCLAGTQLSNEEKLQGYRLLALAYLYEGKDEEAEKAMLEFLKLDPEYELQPGIDPKEFSELYQNYRTSPLYTLGIYGGANWARPRSYKENGLYATPSDKKVYKSAFGFHVFARASRYVYKGLNVHLDLGYMQSTFTYSHDILEGYTTIDPNSEPTATPTKGVTIESSESQSGINLPVSLSYTFLQQKTYRPYIIAGAEFRYLFNASSSITKNYLDPNIASVELADIAGFKERRNSLAYSALFGAGVKRKIPGADIFFEARYQVGLSDQVKEDVTSTNDDAMLWNFYEFDNKFTLDNLNFSFGYTYYFYKPRKMKKVKSQVDEKQMKAEEEKQKKEAEKKAKDEEKKPKKEGDGGDPSEKRQIIE